MKLQIFVILWICVITLVELAPSPTWPQHFTTNWTIYDVPALTAPPYPSPNGIPDPPYCAGRGLTYYDWKIKSMIEKYYDFCVPIFPGGNKWKCDFLNTKAVSYLITYEDRPLNQPPCCIFLEPWYPPSPNFIQQSGLQFNETTSLNGQNVDWYLLQAPYPNEFGYGFYEDNIPAAFFFAGVVGWTMQYFEDFQNAQPPSDAFAIPDSCSNAPNCTIWGK